MGKKKKRNSRKKKHDEVFENAGTEVDIEMIDNGPKGAKYEARRRKKLKKQQKREQQKADRSKNKKTFDGWHIVSVYTSCEMNKLELLTKIGEYVEVEFRPFGFHNAGGSSVFYIESNLDAANGIACLDRRLYNAKNQKMAIKVRAVPVLDIVLANEKLEIFKRVLAKRYDDKISMLDLTRLYMDSDLLDNDILAPLECPSIFKQTMELVKDNIPNLKILNLSFNKLKVSHTKIFPLLKNLSPLNKLHIEALNLENNLICDQQVLKHIKVFPLKELSLQHNLFLEKIKDPLAYIKLVHKEIPSLKILDTVDINTYLSENDKTNSSDQKVSSSSVNGINGKNGDSGGILTESNVKSYLELFYSIFDSSEKIKLIQAYSPEAKFEIRCSGADLNGTFIGQASISEALSKLPSFKHIQSTFGLKILSMTHEYCCLQVQGDCTVNESLLMSIKRSMKLIPFNQGLCCSEDLLEMSTKS